MILHADQVRADEGIEDSAFWRLSWLIAVPPVTPDEIEVPAHRLFSADCTCLYIP